MGLLREVRDRLRDHVQRLQAALDAALQTVDAGQEAFQKASELASLRLEALHHAEEEVTFEQRERRDLIRTHQISIEELKGIIEERPAKRLLLFHSETRHRRLQLDAAYEVKALMERCEIVTAEMAHLQLQARLEASVAHEQRANELLQMFVLSSDAHDETLQDLMRVVSLLPSLSRTRPHSAVMWSEPLVVLTPASPPPPPPMLSMQTSPEPMIMSEPADSPVPMETSDSADQMAMSLVQLPESAFSPVHLPMGTNSPTMVNSPTMAMGTNSPTMVSSPTMAMGMDSPTMAEEDDFMLDEPEASTRPMVFAASGALNHDELAVVKILAMVFGRIHNQDLVFEAAPSVDRALRAHYAASLVKFLAHPTHSARRRHPAAMVYAVGHVGTAVALFGRYSERHWREVSTVSLESFLVWMRTGRVNRNNEAMRALWFVFLRLVRLLATQTPASIDAGMTLDLAGVLYMSLSAMQRSRLTEHTPVLLNLGNVPMPPLRNTALRMNIQPGQGYESIRFTMVPSDTLREVQRGKTGQAVISSYVQNSQVFNRGEVNRGRGILKRAGLC